MLGGIVIKNTNNVLSDSCHHEKNYGLRQGFCGDTLISCALISQAEGNSTFLPMTWVMVSGSQFRDVIDIYLHLKNDKKQIWCCYTPLYYMMTSSDGNIFSVTGPLCGEFSTQMPVTRSFHNLIDRALNKRLSKQSWDWWFEIPSPPWWHHCIKIRTDSIVWICLNKCPCFKCEWFTPFKDPFTSIK